MLHNSGPYGPNEVPINMGAPRNMTQMSGSMNLAHNVNNLGKMPSQPPQTGTSHYNVPDYSNYGHTPLNMTSQMSPFPIYPTPSQPSYNLHNSSQIHDTSWQNNTLPMNLNTQCEYTNIIYYNNDKRPELIDNEYREQSIIRKAPLNIPQIPTKAFHKQMNDINFGLNYDNFRYYDHNLDLSTKTQDRLVQDSNRRKSLENTVRLIENILINSTSSSKSKPVSPDCDKQTENADERPINATDLSYDNSSDAPEKTAPEHDKELMDPQISTTKEDSESDEIDESSQSSQELKSDSKPESSEKAIESTETEQESQDDEPQDIKPVINIGIVENMSVKASDHIVIKVEKTSWTDTEFLQPFHRDMHGVTRDNVMPLKIIDSETSVKEAEETIKFNTDSDSENTKPENFYECPYCNLFFSNAKRFLIHTKWHSFGLTNEKRMELAKDKEIRRTQRREAKAIEKINSQEIVDMKVDGEVYPCKDCDKIFSAKTGLKNHRQKFHPTRVRECKICRKSVVGWAALRAHLATHTGESGFQCTECPKRFKYAHSLAKHRDTHLEKTQACPECPKKFGSVNLLKMHMKTHERMQRGTTFHCSYCGKGFFESYNLQVHERTHRNERPFLCQICNTSFGTNSSLKRHLKVSHSKTKPHVCSVCHRSFSTSSIRDRHEMRVHGDPEDFKFVCDQCPCKYLNPKDLQKHIYKAHPKGKRRKKVQAPVDSE